MPARRRLAISPRWPALPSIRSFLRLRRSPSPSRYTRLCVPPRRNDRQFLGRSYPGHALCVAADLRGCGDLADRARRAATLLRRVRGDDARRRPRRSIARGPVASQEAIKLLSGDGGGFFNANSAHPFENPTALTNLAELLLIFLSEPPLPIALAGWLARASRMGPVWRYGDFVQPGPRRYLWRGSQRQPGACQSRKPTQLGPRNVGRQHGRQGSPFRDRPFGAVRHVSTASSDGAVNACTTVSSRLAAGCCGQHDARRGHRRRPRVRTFRHAAVRHCRGLSGRTDDRTHAGISRQQDRTGGSEDDDPGLDLPPSATLGLSAIACVAGQASPGSAMRDPMDFPKFSTPIHQAQRPMAAPSPD